MLDNRLLAFALVTALGLGAMACGDDDTGGVDAGPGDGDAGEQSVPAEAEAALQALTRGVGTSAALAGPLLADSTMLRDDGRLDRPAERDGAVQERVENGVSGNSIVTDPACTAFAWNLAELSVTITFTSCVMEATSEPLDGSATLDVNLRPTELILTFSSLMAGDLGLDGEVGLRVGGACGGADLGCTPCMDGDLMCREMEANQQTLWADINFQLGADFNVVLDDVQLDHDGTGTTVGGTGTIGSPMFSGSFTGSMVKWNTMECLPSSGTLVYQPAGGAAINVEFLSTTPADGFVMVQFPPLMPFRWELFEPCPTM